MKTALKVTVVLLFLLVAAIITIPFFIDVDKSRPMLVKEVNERINGKFELGQLKLSLWGRVQFNAAGLKLSDAYGKDVLSVKDVHLNIPYLSLLTGSPRASFVLNEPSIHVVRNGAGQINLMSIMKQAPTSGEASGADVQKTSSGAAQNQPLLIPPILMKSQLSFAINHAKLAFEDLKTKESYKVSDFSFTLKDVSPSSRMPFEVVAVLGLDLANGTKVNGPLKLNGALKASGPSATPFDTLDGEINLVMDDMDIIVPGQMSKRPGVALRAETAAQITKDTATISKLLLRLADVEIKGTASADLKTEPMSGQLAIESNQFDVEKLGAIFTAVVQNQLNGKIKIKANAQGQVTALNYGAELDFDGMTVKPASLAEALALKGKVVIATNEVKSLTLDMSAPSLNAKLTGSLKDFSAPKFAFNFDAEDTNLDKLLVKTKSAPAAATSASAKPSASAATNGATKSGETSAASAQDLNASFAPLRANPLAAKSSGTFTFKANSLVSSNVHLRDVKGKFSMAQLVMRIDEFSFKAFDGSFKTNLSIDAKPAKPLVAIQSQITGMRTEKMVESQMTFAKNTMSGIFSGKVNIGGAGLNRSDINQWKGSGDFSLADAKFASLEIGRQINEGLIQKLPPLIKDRVNISDRLLNWKGEYKVLAAKFNLDKGTLSLPELTGTAADGKGLDLKGSGRVSIVDYTAEINADLIDRQGMLGAGFPKDKRYNMPAVSTRMTGSLYSPTFDWGHTLSQLAKNTAQDVVKQKASEVLNKQVENIKAPEAVKGLLKGLFR